MKILPNYFFATLFLGMMSVYLISPKPRVVVKTPTPRNAGEVTYVDDSGVCYKYQKQEIMCPMDPTIKIVNYEEAPEEVDE